MGEKDIVRIMVGRHTVSIAGLQAAVSEVKGKMAKRSDAEVGSAMLEILEKNNYIPASTREEYRTAFAREYRRFMGEPFTETISAGLDIKVLGAGCDQCNKLEQLVMQTLTDLNIPANVEHIMDVREIARYGVLGVPALLINGKVKWTGSVPPHEKLKSLVQQAAAEAKN